LTATDDMSIITTPTDSMANPNNSKHTTKSAVPDGALKKFKPTICKVHMSNVQHMDTVAQTQVSLLSARGWESSTHMVGYLDKDSHADMHCAGKNCVMLSTTGFSCNVSPFYDQYEAHKDMEIVKSATAYQHPSGQVIYKIMNILLWFGNEMENLLFNGLIACDAGNNLCTNEQGLGSDLQQVESGQNMSVKMERQGNKIGVKMFKPPCDEVLQAIQSNSPNVIYLNPELEYPPIRDELGVAVIWYTRIPLPAKTL
jgi:hypothetical protein